LQLVVGKLDMKVILQPSKEVERLQAINPQRFEEVFARGQFLARNFKMRGRKSQDLFEDLIGSLHSLIVKRYLEDDVSR